MSSRAKIICVYKILCTDTGKFYIGSTKDWVSRKRVHLAELQRGRHKNLKLQSAWNKYGDESFTFLPLEILDDERHLLIREQALIDEHECVDFGFNIAPRAATCARRITENEREQIRVLRDTSTALLVEELHRRFRGSRKQENARERKRRQRERLKR